MIDRKDIQAFCNQVGSRFQPEKIILFGSYAYGQPTEDSDVDLLVIMPFEGSPPKQALAIKKTVGRPFRMDLLVKHPEEIHWRYAGGDPMIGDILDKGIVLYERSGDDYSGVA